MTTVLVADTAQTTGIDLDVEASILGPDVNIVRHLYDGDEPGLIAACQDADVVLTAFVPLTRSVINALPKCRLISVAATGYSSVDIDAAADANISVCAIDDYCSEEVADHTMLLMLALCRRLLEYHEQVQTKDLWQWDALTGLRSLGDMTLGLVGLGNIGRAVARRASGFGMSVIAHEPYADISSASELGVGICDLNEIFERSDVISLHCSLSADNEKFIDKNAFQCMAKRPILINCARGGLIDEAALADALDTGQVSAAGLDVLSEESPDLAASPLTGRHNVILTPHVAFYSDRSILENRRISASNIRRFLDGEHSDVRKYIHHAGS
jgi:phosphoglycerate dehydrogenase-like enzyme